jgi:hypothetical protein
LILAIINSKVEKLIIIQMVVKYFAFSKSVGSILQCYVQKTGPSPEPAESSPHLSILFSPRTPLILSSHL